MVAFDHAAVDCFGGLDLVGVEVLKAETEAGFLVDGGAVGDGVEDVEVFERDDAAGGGVLGKVRRGVK